jgi:hypothetical protein
MPTSWQLRGCGCQGDLVSPLGSACASWVTLNKVLPPDGLNTFTVLMSWTHFQIYFRGEEHADQPGDTYGEADGSHNCLPGQFSGLTACPLPPLPSVPQLQATLKVSCSTWPGLLFRGCDGEDSDNRFLSPALMPSCT